MATKFSESMGQLTLLLEDSPASLSPSPGSEEARKMTVISGQKCYELYKKFIRLGCLVKMLLESSAWYSTRCFLIWKVKVTKHNRLLFQLVPLMPRTEGIGSGLLPTANAWDGRRGPGKEFNLKSKFQKDRTLETLIQKGLFGKNHGLKLQPAFVEWMMGFPLKWTEPND